MGEWSICELWVRNVGRFFATMWGTTGTARMHNWSNRWLLRGTVPDQEQNLVRADGALGPRSGAWGAAH